MIDEEKYETAYMTAEYMIEETEIEPTSAFKQAASDEGIAEGEEMREFVTWARERYCPGAWD